MRPIVQLVGAMTPTLPQHHRVGQRRRPRGDMHGCTAGKVQPTHLIRPPAGVPGPAGDRVVYESRPDEHEYDAWQHPPSLGDSAGGDGHRDSREHPLVHGEEEVGDPL